MRTLVLTAIVLMLANAASAQDAGQLLFTQHCASCHGTDGNGGELGPNIATRVPLRSDEELAAVVRQGLGAAGMPGFPAIGTDELPALIATLRGLKPRFGSTPEHQQLTLADGSMLAGLVLNQGSEDLQLLGDDHRLHLLRRGAAGWRQVSSGSDWTSYNGELHGSRYTRLDAINRGNVAQLALAWMFNFTSNSNLQTTPVVSEGVMYVTSANEVYALDAGSGREIWRYQRARTRGLIGNAASGANRGAAIAGDRLFMLTDHAHVIALDKHSGTLLWDTEMADWRQNYNATGAPLVVGDLVIAGTSGGDEGVRGFVAAYDQASGREVWRWWSTPLPGEPGSETWQGTGLAHPAGATWMTGTYDPGLDLLYWTVGNPGPDLIGDDRLGDNLYTDSVVALDPATGALQWHFQFTPHDVWDYDAQETPALVDAEWKGQPRKLLIQANRNGFFYVLDRTTGEFLDGWQYTKEVTWASGLDATGRPIRVPGMEPTREGIRVCPSLTGASNWYSTAYMPETGLYYVQTEDKCGMFTRVDVEWEAGKGYMGGSFAPAPEPAQRLLRAIDIQQGKTVWEVPQVGRASSWGGVLATAGGLVFFGDDSGTFAAVDAVSGERVWSFAANARWRASPMSYEFDGRQYIAVSNGSTIMAFALPDQTSAVESAQALEAERNAMPDTPGSGRYPALKEVDPGLPDQVVYRPADLAALGNTRLGIYAFGNGSCTDDAAHTRLHPLEVASHGYLVIVPGAIYTGPGAIERPAHLPPAGPEAVLTTHQQLHEAISWALAENARPGSPYFGRIDPAAVAVSGFSCGGLQALMNAGDPRVAAVVVMNAGLFPEGPTTMAGMTADKSLLRSLHSPVLYVLGGESDIAYSAGMDDFARIDHVPAAVANIDRGHGGTYWDPNGGAAAQVVVRWLNWQLRGDAEAARYFLGEDCGLCRDPAWTLQTKGFN